MLARLRSVRISPARFTQLACASVAGLFAVVTTGAFVRLTASGLGCDNWPRCGNAPFPEQGFHAFVEFGNRIVALIAMILTLVAWLASRRVDGLPRGVSLLALLAAVGTVAQIPLGGLTVIFNLDPLLVMSHFLLALAMLALTVIVALEARAFEIGRPASAVPRPFGWLALALVPVGLALVVTGSFVTAAGPHSGGSDIPRLGNLLDSIYIHVRVAAVFGVAFLVLLAGLVRTRRTAPGELKLAAALLVALLAQMAVGEYQWRNQLPWGIVLVHVALAAVVWSALVALAVRLVWAAGMVRAPVAFRLGRPAVGENALEQ